MAKAIVIQIFNPLAKAKGKKVRNLTLLFFNLKSRNFFGPK